MTLFFQASDSGFITAFYLRKMGGHFTDYQRAEGIEPSTYGLKIR